MLKSDASTRRNPPKKAVALQYDVGDGAPVIVASGMGYMAEKIVEVASDSGVPIYEDNSLATILTQLKLGQEIPEELYKAIVEIYVYFLHFDPAAAEKKAEEAQGRAQEAREAAAAEAVE
ncbi:MAG: EscU/YscU/HrcU family type III secretion system export apparatus switch protein [Butyricicoccus sp.]|nr:EscU/YscU/HrcU family type III secretion system export apparatus switch protein [Butyricicoccus sp.]